MVSKEVPFEAEIVLKPEVLDPHNHFIYSYSCTISTFRLCRAVNITLEFGPGNVKSFYVDSDPNVHVVLLTKDYAISGVIKDKLQHTFMVWVNVSSDNLTAVTCSAAFTYKKIGWISVRKDVHKAMTKEITRKGLSCRNLVIRLLFYLLSPKMWFRSSSW